tara:strand:- start:817 stop:1041 length:225 start_codon:yes stop_codon:yes gene_type:complete
MDNIFKIDCTTTVVLRNTKTQKIYKDKLEKDADIADVNTDTVADHIAQDLTVVVSPKGLNILQKVMNENKKPTT